MKIMKIIALLILFSAIINIALSINCQKIADVVDNANAVANNFTKETVGFTLNTMLKGTRLFGDSQNTFKNYFVSQTAYLGLVRDIIGRCWQGAISNVTVGILHVKRAGSPFLRFRILHSEIRDRL
uniref:Uncharacterized protein n=1 Tax=Strigamia maritima TaxID=126957 RepID=T1IGU5_STRMM